jgi:hypothetical protein
MTLTITTSDGITAVGFETIQAVVGDIEENMQSEKPEGGFGSHTAFATDSKKISSILHKMQGYHWQKKVYSKDSNRIFTDDFVKSLRFLLAWLKGIGSIDGQQQISVEVSAVQMKDALKWLPPVMNALDCCKDEHSESVHAAIQQLNQRKQI